MKLFMIRGVNSTNGRVYANTIVELPEDQAAIYIASALGRKPTAKDKEKAAAFLKGSPIADMLKAEDKKREDAKLALEASENDDDVVAVKKQLADKVVEFDDVQKSLKSAQDDLGIANTAVSDAEKSLQEKQDKIDNLEKQIEQLTSPTQVDDQVDKTAS